MSNTTTTTAKSAPKQFTFGVTEKCKNELGELRKDFTRPAAVSKAPPVPMSEKELIEVLYEVATDRRFKSVPVMETVEIDGEQVTAQVYDADGMPVFESVDLFSEKWEAIKARDYAETATFKKDDKIKGLIEAIRTLGRQMAKSEGEIQVMIETALRAAPVAAE